jgi:hypothetical protein
MRKKCELDEDFASRGNPWADSKLMVNPFTLSVNVDMKGNAGKILSDNSRLLPLHPTQFRLRDFGWLLLVFLFFKNAICRSTPLEPNLQDNNPADDAT